MLIIQYTWRSAIGKDFGGECESSGLDKERGR